MAVTDLAGTTWVFNNALPSHFEKKGEYYTEGDIRGVTPTSDYGYFIDFIWKDENGEYNCNYIYNYNYDAGTTIGVATYPNGPAHYFNGSMTITGGTDATNTDLIAWLEANATQQTVSTKVSVDLTTLPGWASLSTGSHNITVVAKADGYRDSEPSAAVSVTKEAEADVLAGKWVFNDNIASTTSSKYSINFASNNESFIAIRTPADESSMAYFTTDKDFQLAALVSNLMGKTTWENEAYKIITITSKLSEVENGDALLTWLQANATKQ